jgi:hypothetical protein
MNELERHVERSSGREFAEPPANSASSLVAAIQAPTIVAYYCGAQSDGSRPRATNFLQPMERDSKTQRCLLLKVVPRGGFKKSCAAENSLRGASAVWPGRAAQTSQN